MSRISQQMQEASVYDSRGRRKYLNSAERARFKARAEQLPLSEKCFCLMLYYTGMRISEALAVKAYSVDQKEGIVIIPCLKRRNKTLFRAIPLPKAFLKNLASLSPQEEDNPRMWAFSRKTGYRIIKRTMADTNIKGVHACPKGLRHGFGILCIENNIPLPIIAKWMGHSSIQTTSIYLNVMGKEERQFAKRLWK